MNVYTCTTFHGHYPVGAAAVVAAYGAEHAAELLEEELSEIGLKQSISPADMELFAVGIPDDKPTRVQILVDGDY